jgi:prepilin-type N-terminal cleavage/methylation domain-containing protein
MLRHLTGTSGQTLAELMITIGIFGVILSAALPSFDPRRQDINTATTTLIGDFRHTRARAITSGTHFAIKVLGPHQYEVQRLIEEGADWPLDAVVQTVTLPRNVRLELSGTDTVEFNTRGLMVTTIEPAMEPQPLYVYLFEEAGGGTRSFSVWPSGQVNEEF